MIWFVSDLHFCHQRIIGLCNRPFCSVEEMDSTLIVNWNQKVKAEDDVYIIGDLFCRDEIQPENILRQLNGRKHLILGNHDPMWINRTNCELYFETVNLIEQLEVEGIRYTLCHYPMIEWPSSRIDNAEIYGFLIHGHTHNCAKKEYYSMLKTPFQLNASVEINSYFPVSIEELKQNNRRFKLQAMNSAIQKAEFIVRDSMFNQFYNNGIPCVVTPFACASKYKRNADKVIALLVSSVFFNYKVEKSVLNCFDDNTARLLYSLQRTDESIGEYVDKIRKAGYFEIFSFYLDDTMKNGGKVHFLQNEKEYLELRDSL